ncbi:hypothetical protein [Chitinophaga eiseniae]|uniref:Glycine zipper 2TM domain-containing protein n=1 Tax=Chitinophaga eiseniae TaxID=634771 RepID=A0A847SSZ6_9BACT|nr:hypothetical protein [Chitinophaga eiseniae]NLR82267.1 hypothetical protein [Chitinophaga eiseniae]
MQKTDKVVISATTLITSLLCYSYAKDKGKDAAPFVMVGAFIGSLIGEALVEQMGSGQTYKQLSENGYNRNPGTG